MSRILVVEDDDANREFLRVLLENEAFVVAAARDGEEALDWLRTHDAPDLILLDLEMPRVNGWEFLHAADRAALLRGTRVLMLTGRSEQLRVLDWISKPALPEQLIERIRFYLQAS